MFSAEPDSAKKQNWLISDGNLLSHTALIRKKKPNKPTPNTVVIIQNPSFHRKASLWRVEQHQTIHVYATGHDRKDGKSEDWDIGLYISSQSSNTFMGKSWLFSPPLPVVFKVLVTFLVFASMFCLFIS